MTIHLYRNKSDNRCLNKNLKNEIVYNGTLVNESSIINPTIIIETDNVDFNYMYIDEFQRYYYVNDIVVIRNNYISVSCSVDVLMSNRNKIKYIPCVVEKLTDDDKIDKFMVSKTDVELGSTSSIYDFPSGFNDEPKFLLCTMSGLAENVNIDDDPQSEV